MGEQRVLLPPDSGENKETPAWSRALAPRKPARPANERIVGRRGLFDETHDDEALPPRYSKMIVDNKCSSRDRARPPPRRLRRLPIVRGAAPDRPVGY